MKKTYISPTSKVICLDPEESLMQLNNGSPTDPSSANGTPGDDAEYSNRRRNSIWGDEY